MPEIANIATSRTAKLRAAVEEAEEKVEADGSDNLSVQYARSAEGFFPVGKTSKALRPDIYSLRYDGAANRYVFAPHHLVTDKLMRLSDSKSEEVIKEIQHFWTLRDVFRAHGYVHKRGFLLHGPPGSGKTSTVSIVAEEMVKNGGIVILADNPSLASNMLRSLREVEPFRPLVVVLEDIDSIIDNHGDEDTLSLLDGENSIDGVVYVATTNYPEDLEDRIINRPSRFDRVVRIGTPTAKARRQYLESKNLGLSKKEMAKWISVTSGLSIAHLKEMIVSVCCFGMPVDEVAKRVRKMSTKPTSQSDSGDSDAPVAVPSASR